MPAASLTLLHLSDLQFGRHHLFQEEGVGADEAYDTLFERLRTDLLELRDDPDLQPDVVVMTGDLAEWGMRKEFEQVTGFAAKLEELLGLKRRRILVVPGNHDINRSYCEGYFNFCKGNDEKPKPPYWPKWTHYHRFFEEFYAGVDGYTFTEQEPWTLFELPELSLVVAGLNSTMKESHRDEDHYGHVGERQLEWFARRLHARRGWVRIGAIHHNVVRRATLDDENLRDAKDMQRILERHLNLVLHGHRHEACVGWWSPTLPIMAAGSAAVSREWRRDEVPNQYQLIRLGRGRLRWWTRMYAADQKRFIADCRGSDGGNTWEHSQKVAFADVDDAFPDPSSEPPEPSPTAPTPEVSARELDRYLVAIEALHRELPLAGFETKARVTIELDDLCVPLDAMIERGSRRLRVFSSAQQAAEQGGKDKREGLRGEPARIALADAFVKARSIGQGCRGVVLLGDPGSGKTTHLRQVLLKVVRDGSKSIGLREGTVPVFLPLRELRTLKDRSEGLEGFIRQQLRTTPPGMATDFGERLLARGKLLLLLDGLDEVSDEDERAEVAQWIDDIRKVRRKDFILMTCRYAGYSTDLPLGAGFLELHLRPMNDTQVETFVRNWYRIVEQATGHGLERATELADDLLDAISTPELAASRRVNEMTRNPLLLTSICLVHRDRGELPTRRAALYYEATQVLLERWRKVTKRLPVSFPAADARKALQPAALWMHGQEGRTRATAEQLEPPIRQGLAAAGHRDVPVDRFLRAIRDESGLLTGWDVSSFGFMHLGFQEYLAARELWSKGFGDETVLRALAGRFGESWWQEVILLMVALDEPAIFEPFMRVLLEQPEFEQWATLPVMQLLLNETSRVSAVPLVEFLRRHMRSNDKSVHRNVIAAAGLLKQAMPADFDALVGEHRENPPEPMRLWWAAQYLSESRRVGVITVEPGGYEMVQIPAGTFLQGSPHGVGYDDERPQQRVELASFFIGRYPVTNAQYERFLEANPDVLKPEYWSDRRFNQPEQPVVGVSWYEAKKYCEWAGPDLTLPTEAQWEYACRAGTTSQWSFGDDESELGRFGWFKENSENQTHPVGQKDPNPWGAYDMHGNVREFCEEGAGGSAMLESYEKTGPRVGDGLRRKPEGSAYRVMRGGSWGIDAVLARSAYRSSARPDVRSRFIGFRPVQLIPGSFTPAR